MAGVAVLFGIAVVCLAVALFGRSHSRKRAGAVAAWPTVDGVVTSSDVVDASSTGPKYLPWITYNYTVNGSAYEGDRLRFGGRVMFRSRDKALDYLKRFPSQGPVKVYYDPKDPRRALLDPSAQSYVFVVFAILAALAALAGVIVLIGGLTGHG